MPEKFKSPTLIVPDEEGLQFECFVDSIPLHCTQPLKALLLLIATNYPDNSKLLLLQYIIHKTKIEFQVAHSFIFIMFIVKFLIVRNIHFYSKNLFNVIQIETILVNLDKFDKRVSPVLFITFKLRLISIVD